MGKEAVIRCRVNGILKDRLKQYIEDENRRGRGIDESSVMRDAIVEFLDREEQRPALPGRVSRLNELPPAAPDPRLVTPQQKNAAQRAVADIEKETANSADREHLDEAEARKMRARHSKNPDDLK